MDIAVLVEPISGERFRASTNVPTHVVAEGESRDDAVAQLQNSLQSRLANAEDVQVTVGGNGAAHPWLALAGTWREHPDKTEFERNIQEFRAQADEDEDRP